MEISITLIIIIITAIISISGFSNSNVIDKLIFYPPAVTNDNQWYRFITCGFIHADYGHLIFNMLSLYFFGRYVESSLIDIFGESGTILYIVLYLSALVVSLLLLILKTRIIIITVAWGASGAVSAVIFAGLMIAPETEVLIFFIPIPIPGFIFAPLYLLISALMDRKGGSNINHSAHIWGAIYGLVFIIVAGKAIGYDAVGNGFERIKLYMQTKGWI